MDKGGGSNVGKVMGVSDRGPQKQLGFLVGIPLHKPKEVRKTFRATSRFFRVPSCEWHRWSAGFSN